MGVPLRSDRLKCRFSLLGVAFPSDFSSRPMPETPRGIPSNPWEKSGREGNGTRYGIHSPYTPLLHREDEELVPTCPPPDAESTKGNGVSLEALAGIVRQEINAAVTPMHSQLSSLQVTLGARMDQVGNVLRKHDLQIQKLEQYVADSMDQGFSNNMTQDVEKQLQDLQTQIDDLKEPGTAARAGSADLCKTMVVGGLIGLSSLPEATRWLNTQLSQLDCPKHVGTYMKNSSFQGLMFVKFKSVDERDLAVGILRSAGLTNGDNKIWATQDLPIPTRARKMFLLSLRWQLGEWGFVKREIEIDECYTKMMVGGKVVVAVASEGEGITFQWMDAWAQWDGFQKSDELKDLIAKANAILQKQGRGGGKSKAAGRSASC